MSWAVAVIRATPRDRGEWVAEHQVKGVFLFGIAWTVVMGFLGIVLTGSPVLVLRLAVIGVLAVGPLVVAVARSKYPGYLDE